MSSFLKLNSNDFVKGLVVSVLAAVFTSLAATFNTPGFDFGALDLGELFKAAFIGFSSYMSKNLLTDSNGKVGGVL